MDEARLSLIAWVWLALGLSFVGITAAVAVSHFGFGMPIHTGHSDQPRLATSAEILTTLAAFGAGGSLFTAVGGAILLRRLKR